MLKNFRAALESPDYPGEVTIYAEDEKGRTVFCAAARDALADAWQTDMLNTQITWHLVMQQMGKISRVMSLKYELHPECFDPSVHYPHQLPVAAIGRRLSRKRRTVSKVGSFGRRGILSHSRTGRIKWVSASTAADDISGRK